MRATPPNPDVPHALVSAHAVCRFLSRIIILSIFATLGAQGFAETLENLLVLAASYCCAIGGVRREWPLRPSLTHYDEAAAYGAIAAAIAA